MSFPRRREPHFVRTPLSLTWPTGSQNGISAFAETTFSFLLLKLEENVVPAQAGTPFRVHAAQFDLADLLAKWDFRFRGNDIFFSIIKV